MNSSEHLQHEISFYDEKTLLNRSSKKVLLLGAGALGSWLLEILSRQGYSQITILDFDRVERKNFGTQNYGKSDIGRPKSVISANKILLELGISVKSINDKLTQLNCKKYLSGYDLIVDVFDNHESRNLVKEFCQKTIPCMHCGMSGDGFVEVEWNEKYKAYPVPKTEIMNNEPCEYPLAANLVHFAVTLAAECINIFFDKGIKRSVHFTMKDMHCHILH